MLRWYTVLVMWFYKLVYCVLMVTSSIRYPTVVETCFDALLLAYDK